VLKVIAVVVLAAGMAHTAHADRCADGVAALAKNDLPHAALYLDGCDDAEPKAMHELRKKLEASSLSVLEISSNPSGLDAQIDTLPGEHLVTPTTVYVPAGVHEVHAGELVKKVTTVARARSVLIFEDAAPKPPAPPKPGNADFRDEAPEADQPTGPPPPTPHRPMMPCKFTNSCTEAGDQIEDPFARRAARARVYPHAQFELRGGTEYADALHPSLGIGVIHRFPWQDDMTTHPWLLWGRDVWSPRADSYSLAATAAIAKLIAAGDNAWVIAGVGGVYDTWSGLGAAGILDVALREFPISLGAEYQELFQGMPSRVFVVELGVGFRRY
jgi:hypothetical protein